MLRLRDIRLSFPDKVLFDSLSWTIKPGQRIGLVGDNGAGKTTLLKIITGQTEPDSGDVSVPKGLSIGYLAQDFSDSSRTPVRAFVREAATDVEALEAKIASTERRLEELDPSAPDHDDVVLSLAMLHERYQFVRGFALDARVAQILSGLGFDDDAALRPMNAFSGGWQMRAALARLLVQQPDLLLLDEPTNHLDTDTVEWLERFLKNYRGSLVVVSHDRYFLDRMIQAIAELEYGKLRDFAGNYTQYRAEKAATLESRKAAQTRQQKKIAETERFIERFRYKASKAKQVQSRVKMLESVDRIEVEQEAAGIRLEFPPCERSGEEVVSATELAKRYAEQSVFEDLDLAISRGERVALVGPNGAGKSTLMRLIAGLEAPNRGAVKWGHNVSIACYTQGFEAKLQSSNSVLDELGRGHRGLGENRLRSLLGCFRFSKDAVLKPVQVLSGGEKSRLAVARLLLGNANFLVLDEPTNHLDIKAKDVLQQALRSFQGTVLLVSHDRYFLDGVVTRVLELRHGTLTSFIGSYSDYLERRERDLAPAGRNEEPAKTAAQSNKKQSYQDRKARQRALRQAERAVAESEEKIARLEQGIQDLEQQMLQQEIYDDPERLKQVTTEHGLLRKDRDRLYETWEQQQEAVEAARLQLEGE